MLAGGEHLLRAGDRFHNLFAVRSGCLKTFCVDAGGREHVVNFHFPGEIVGADAIYPGRHVGSIVALSTSVVCSLPFDALTRLSVTMPEIHQQLIRLISREIFSTAVIAGDFTAEERLAAFLVMIAARNPAEADSPASLELPMSRQDIANYLRLAPETVSRILARFQQAGLLTTDRRHVTLLDPAGLYAIGECMNPYATLRPGSAATERHLEA